MPRKEKTEPVKDLIEDLRKLKIELFVVPLVWGLLAWLILDAYALISGFTLTEMFNRTLVLTSGIFLLPAFVFCRVYIEYNALKKYLDMLKRKKFEETVECGRDYYSIKRKGFLGLDGHGYNVDDDDEIIKDIETFGNY